jgi:molecular chaperone DnaJ
VKGDIHYRFVIDVPQNLSEEQQKAVDELSRTMGSDPRSALFPNGSDAGASTQATGAGKGSEG